MMFFNKESKSKTFFSLEGGWMRGVRGGGARVREFFPQRI